MKKPSNKAIVFFVLATSFVCTTLNPLTARADVVDVITSGTNFVQNSSNAVNDVAQAKNGVLTPELQQEMQATGALDDAQSFINQFCQSGDTQCAGKYMALYASENEVDNPNSSFRQAVNNTQDIASSLEDVGASGVQSNPVPAAAQEIAQPSVWTQIFGWIPDTISAITDIFGNRNTSSSNGKQKSNTTADMLGGVQSNNLQPQTPSAASNPFQALYDFFPAGGQMQSCVKSLLGSDFKAVYGGGTPPASLVVNKSNGVSESFAPAVEWCINSHSGTQVLNNMPPAIGQCYKDALGTNFERMMSGSYTPTSDEQNQIASCPAVKEMQDLITSLEQYSAQQLGVTQIKNGCTYAVNLANVSIQFEMTASANGTGVPTGMDDKEISAATLKKQDGMPILQLDLTGNGQQMLADVTKQINAQHGWLSIYTNGKQATPPVLVAGILNENQMLVALFGASDADVIGLFGGRNLTSSCEL